MEFANNDVFNITYNSSLDRLQIKKQKRTSKALKSMKKHKIMSMVIALFFTFSFINAFLVYSFARILMNVNLV